MEPLPWDKPGPAAVDPLTVTLAGPLTSARVSRVGRREARQAARGDSAGLNGHTGAAGPQGDCGQGGPGLGRHRGHGSCEAGLGGRVPPRHVPIGGFRPWL